jgi:PAS domain S-box-containing protein
MEALHKRIRELEATNKALLREVHELRDFVETAAIPLHWVNGSGIITWANQAELDLLGYSREEYINHHIGKFHADKKAIEDILYRLINKESLVNYPAQLICKDGSILGVLITSSAYWLNDQFIHTRCFTREIAEVPLRMGAAGANG